jgi:tetratricopeptide (TPR) repeat protein
VEADRLVLSGLDRLLSDAEVLRESLSASRRVDRARLEREATKAHEDAARADLIVEQAMERYEAALALAEKDKELEDIAIEVLRRQRRDAEEARKRVNAALDALNAEPEVDDGDDVDRPWLILSGRIEDAAGDLRKLNAILREHSFEFQLIRDYYTGRLRIVPDNRRRRADEGRARVRARIHERRHHRRERRAGWLPRGAPDLSFFSKNSHKTRES